MTTWPSGLRRWIKAPIFTGAGSNPVVVSFAVSPISYLPNLPIWGSHDGVLLCSTYFLTGRLHQSTAARAAGSIRAGVGSIGAYAFQVRLLLSSCRHNSPQAEELLHGAKCTIPMLQTGAAWDMGGPWPDGNAHGAQVTIHSANRRKPLEIRSMPVSYTKALLGFLCRLYRIHYMPRQLPASLLDRT